MVKLGQSIRSDFNIILLEKSIILLEKGGLFP